LESEIITSREPGRNLIRRSERSEAPSRDDG
jgi:hypothetical protein